MADNKKQAAPTADPRNYELVLKDGASRDILKDSEAAAVAEAKKAADAVRLKDRYDGRTVWEAAP